MVVKEESLSGQTVHLQFRLTVEETPGFLNVIVYNVTEPSYYYKLMVNLISFSSVLIVNDLYHPSIIHEVRHYRQDLILFD